ncbi:isochorismatase family protein [Streptomyces fagopyri]|uniref:isochorismatase family protein n=1 Tax=Streptomyces fagopyri TaxID=2662397 RepID=UPI0036997F84
MRARTVPRTALLVRDLQLGHLVLAGSATGGVVLSTALRAADLDHEVTVLSDARADPDTDPAPRARERRPHPARRGHDRRAVGPRPRRRFVNGPVGTGDRPRERRTWPGRTEPVVRPGHAGLRRPAVPGRPGPHGRPPPGSPVPPAPPARHGSSGRSRD